MTALDRFESRLPGAMTELADERIPDYFDTMLQTTARTRQRPAWSALERWLPMGVIARPLPRPYVPWRPILVGALLLLLAAALLVFYAGAQHRDPPPFGVAANGTLLLSQPNGDIVAVDPGTGLSKPVLADAGAAVTFSPDGRWFYYDPFSTGRPGGLVIARADGSGAHTVLNDAGPAVTWNDWSQDATRLLVVKPESSGSAVLLINPADGTTTTLHFAQAFNFVAQPFGTHQLLLSVAADAGARYFLANDDGSGIHEIPTQSAVNEPALSPDGTKIAYASWEAGDGLQGRIHVMDIKTGVDTLVTSDLEDGQTYLSPVFSPDGDRLLVDRFFGGGATFNVVVIRADGVGAPVVLGPAHSGLNNGAAINMFSPDGTKVIVRFGDDNKTWLFDASTGEGQYLPWATTQFISWQRAPMK